VPQYTVCLGFPTFPSFSGFWVALFEEALDLLLKAI
jgi:hypothetical protein